MRDQTHRFVRTHVAPLVNAIEHSVLRLGYTSLRTLAHLMAREILARATVAALKQIPYPGVVSLGSAVAAQFTPLLRDEVKHEFERIEANPADWIPPGNPTALTLQPDLARDRAALMATLTFLEHSLAFNLDAFADDDAQYIAQRILDDGAFSLPGTETHDASFGDDDGDGGFIPTVIMEPLIPGGPDEEAPVYDLSDMEEDDIGLSAAARRDAAGFDYLTDLSSSSCDQPLGAFFAKLNDLEWLQDALTKPKLSAQDKGLSAREKRLILRVYIHGMAFVAQEPDTAPLELFAALAHLLDLWNQDHPWM